MQAIITIIIITRIATITPAIPAISPILLLSLLSLLLLLTLPPTYYEQYMLDMVQYSRGDITYVGNLYLTVFWKTSHLRTFHNLRNIY